VNRTNEKIWAKSGVGFVYLLSKPSAFLGNVQFSRCKESLNSQSILKLNFVKRVSFSFLFHRLTISAQVTVCLLSTGLLAFDTTDAALHPSDPHTGKTVRARGEPPAVLFFNTLLDS
jgi:hypothetical protein